uniref:Growth regulating estrogen receptor binding 1 n=1 Tax=Gouania willdenowi TaxID=441366 RepID=A0A8C5G847_GOUWI
MGNSYAGQLRTTRFEEVLHNSIEASLRSNTVVPRPVFSQLYLETDQPLAPNGRTENDEEEEKSSESNSPPIPYQMKPPPEGCCTTDGFCQAGKDLRLSSLASDPLDLPPGFSLVGIKSSSIPDNLLVCAVDRRFLPDERGHNALLGFSGNCLGCGEKGFRYFTEFSNHINLKLSTQPKKQKHLKYHLCRNNQGVLVRGAPIYWRGNGRTASHQWNSEVIKVIKKKNTVSRWPHSNAAPPKKRHKGWSPESSATNQPESTIKTPSSSSISSFLPVSSVITNGVRSGHGPLPQLTGNVGEVLISSLLQSCYLSAQTLPRVYQHYGPSPIQPLSTEMQILLTVYYLVQLGPDQVPLIEDLEQIFMRSWRESHLSEIRQYQQPQTSGIQGSQQPLTSSQLPWLAQLAASSCGESVLLLAENVESLAQGLQQMFSRLMEGRLENTNYVVIIVTAARQETQSCVVVTGKHQCRALAESMFSPSEGLKEISHQLSTGAAQDLMNFCNSLGQDGDMDNILDISSVYSSEASPLSSSQDSPEEKKYFVEWREIRPIQLAVARKLLSHVCAIADSSTQNLDLGSFDRVSFLILVPPSEVTFQQTVFHLWSSGVLRELGSLDQECASQREAERYVVKIDQSAEARIDSLIREAHSNSYTLYILVHDHAHWDVSSSSESSLGLVDQLLNSRQVREATNILILHVTSFPFALQTQCTRISPYNEIHWPSAYSNDVDLYHEKTRYFGASELLDSTCSGNSLPLMRYDSSFESMTSMLEERFPKLHSAVIRTTVLIQHYSVALMAASGRLSSSHNLQKHTSVETMELVQSLLTAAQQCPAHHGHMILLRIPCLALAAWAHRRLSRVRKQLGLEDSFEIILGNPNQALNVAQTFTDQIKTWLKIQDAEWVPRTYLELEALPCILILSGSEPLGESLPRSLKYCDLRLINCCYLQRTTLEQELGLAAYLVKAESRVLLNPGPESDQLESDPEKLSSTDNEEEERRQHVDVSFILFLFVGDSPPSHSLHPNPPAQSTRQHSKSTSSASLSPRSSSPLLSCSWARGVSRPPSVLLPRALYDIITASDSSGLPRCTSFLPHMSVAWASSFRPLLSKMMTCTEQSLYYRQWTVPRSHHMDSSNRTEGRSDNFHPRRLLLSGPPQVGKTGAYLHFLGILSRMLIRLMEVDIYDEEDIIVCFLGVFATVKETMPFDYTIHHPKYDDISSVYCPGFKPSAEGFPTRQEDVFLRRRTSRIKLSKYAAYNTYHHCEQCHQYLGFNPRYQMYESTLYAFTFTHLVLGEEIQLYFIIPKSKEHYFSFSQPGGQLEGMRLPLSSDWSPDCIKSPIFTPTTGRHEHGLFNLYHAMDGASHLHILVVKEYEMAVYKKYWPNHIMLVLPTVFNGAGIGAAHFLIKELSYHNLELERSRRLEGGGPAGDVWPFIILADDSLSIHSLQHIQACQDLMHFGLCGIRKWSSRGSNNPREPFSRGHLHDFLLLNVDRSQNVQYDQNRFTCHDVDFVLRLHSAGLLVCRFNSFSVMKKQIAIGGYRTFIIKTKMTDVPTSVGPSQYICAPDSKHLLLATPAQLLLEKYLQHTSLKLFPLSAKNYTHPVLSVDCYLNLGPEVHTCEPHTCTVRQLTLTVSRSPVGDGVFRELQASFGQHQHHRASLQRPAVVLPTGATLCVIGADRSSLRQTVGRLELEEEWRFRLSDEFQTANTKEDRPLFFLTGKHI